MAVGKAVVRIGLCVVLVASVAACGQAPNFGRTQTATFDGQSFRASAKGDKTDRTMFVATAHNPAKSLDGAVQAASYQAVKYCITTYGTSDIDWTVGPDTPPAQLPVSDQVLRLSGQCRDR
ncbi:hypothetical protein [Sagittula sp. SSi028]|uniref:hypothetical protein n=1 Tax=Sagittula sp. SSi028 TaxID=3400636 RepID=UPI003AF880BC